MSKRSVPAKGGATPAKGRAKKASNRKPRKSSKDDLTHPNYLFKAFDTGFDYSNEEWALSLLPVIRLASASCGKDWREHRKIAEALHGPKGWDPAIAETFRQFDRVREHLQALVKMISSAEARWLLSCAYFAPPPKELKRATKPS